MHGKGVTRMVHDTNVYLKMDLEVRTFITAHSAFDNPGVRA